MSMIDTPRRGRPPMEAAPIATTEPPKRTRKPFGSMSLKLAYPDREGFHRHWFNETAGRIQLAQEAGYEHVKSHDGKPVSKIVGTAEGGGAMTAFLMEIPQEYYEEDMAREQSVINEREASLKRGVVQGAEGENQYVPKQGITIR